MSAFKNIKQRSIIINLSITLALALTLQIALIIPFVFAWAIAINMVTFTTFGKDKMAATAGNTRTPEVTFLYLALLGGFPALFLGFNFFKHKRKKPSFFVPMWGVFIMQVLLSAWFYGNLDQVYYKWQNPTSQTTTTAP